FQDLPAEWQDGLVLPVATLLRRATRRITLDDEELREGRVALLAVGELPWQRSPVERALAAGQLLRLARGLTDPGGLDPLGDDATRLRRMLLEVDRQPV